MCIILHSRFGGGEIKQLNAVWENNSVVMASTSNNYIRWLQMLLRKQQSHLMLEELIVFTQTHGANIKQ